MTAGLVVLLAVGFVVLVTLMRSIRIVPQARAGVVERLGRYYRTLDPGLALVVPYIDRVRPLIDLREQVVSFPPQPVITEDNLVVNIDTVVYYQVTDARAAILQAEGVKQSQILTAEGEKQSAILRAEGQRESQRLYAEGQAKAIETVFQAIHEGNPDPELLAYQYLQMLPQIAKGEANKVWIIPSEITNALGSLGGVVESVTGRGGGADGGPARQAPAGEAPLGPPD